MQLQDAQAMDGIEMVGIELYELAVQLVRLGVPPLPVGIRSPGEQPLPLLT
jgi:hypothetical protein